jgi:hypothetical protein
MTRQISFPEDWIDGLDGNDQLLLITLLRFVDAGGTCYPTHDTIAAKVNRSRRWVLAGLKRLQILGRIEITSRISKSGKTSNVYSLRDAQSLRIRCEKNDETPPSDTQTLHMNYTEESKSTPTSRAGQVVNMPLPMPQGWCPSAAIIARALLQFPDMTDQDLADHTAKFISRCRAKAYPYADFDEAWLSWLVTDRKEAKEKASATGSRHESPYERQQRDARDRAAENRRRADDCLARINGRHPRH